jgi:hypothetical protein
MPRRLIIPGLSLRWWWAIAAGVLFASTTVAATPQTSSEYRWARLRTPDPEWQRHIEHDDALTDMLRDSCHLPFDDHTHDASADSVTNLAAYPFLYAASIARLGPAQLQNLGEYLRRGGFLFIDACRNNQINPDIPRFLSRQLVQLKSVLPDATVGKLKPEHPVFSVFFKLKHFPPFRQQDGQEPLYAVMLQDRIIAMISLNGFRCAWSGYADDRENAVESLQMVANIYVYAMTH